MRVSVGSVGVADAVPDTTSITMSLTLSFKFNLATTVSILELFMSAVGNVTVTSFSKCLIAPSMIT